jgi:hypothetical protein
MVANGLDWLATTALNTDQFHFVLVIVVACSNILQASLVQIIPGLATYIQCSIH